MSHKAIVTSALILGSSTAALAHPYNERAPRAVVDVRARREPIAAVRRDRDLRPIEHVRGRDRDRDRDRDRTAAPESEWTTIEPD